MVVRSAPSGAVLRTASPSALLILGASSPMDLASNRIGTTSATTARTTTIPITQPRVQPKLLGPAAATACWAAVMVSMSGLRRSDRVAEVADGLQVRVHRGQPLRHGAGEIRDGAHAAGCGHQVGADRPQVEDHPQ